jgi:hypothetical protein
MSSFDEAFAEWNQLPMTTKRTDVKNLEGAIQANLSRFTQQIWPTLSRSAVGDLVEHSRRELGDLKSWETSGLRTSGSAYATFLADARNLRVFIESARATLKLPPL